MSKNLVLLRDVVNKYHPEFKKNPILQELSLKHPDFFNVEKLIEHTLAEVGPYNFIDGEHCDYDDGSDCKTASIREKPKTVNGNSYPGEISGVTSVGGSQKIGGLRCIIYNPHTNGLRYYYLPKKFWENNITYHPTSGIGKILYCYNTINGSIKKFMGYECDTFEELANSIDYNDAELSQIKRR